MKKSLIFSLVIVFLITAYLYQDRETMTLDNEIRPKLPGSFIQLDKGSVHYQLEGDAQAPLVVLVHGFSIPYYIWEPTYRFFREQGYRVLRFDLYGRGFSDRPDSDYDFGLYVDQLKQLIDSLRIDRPFHLVGLSMGGPISTRYTVENPQQVLSLSLISPLVRTPDRWETQVLKVPGLGEYLANVVMIDKIRNGLNKAVFDTSVFPDWKAEFDKQVRFKGYRRAILASVRYLAGKDFSGLYSKLTATKIPLQLFWGRQDATLPFADHEVILQANPTIEFHGLDDTGHLAHYEHPARVNQWLMDFFRLHEAKQENL